VSVVVAVVAAADDDDLGVFFYLTMRWMKETSSTAATGTIRAYEAS
jgi:hypothetical protein